MNKREKELLRIQFEKERKVIKQLEREYGIALALIGEKIKLLQADELTQSRIYHLQYQKALQGQIQAIVDKLQGDEYTTIQQFLHDSYTDTFVGTMYDLHGQGVPLIVPIDQKQAVKAILTDSEINEGLYESLGVDASKLKKTISSEITRGIASGLTFTEMARNIANASKAPLSRAKLIVRTEAHRIQQEAAYDSSVEAKQHKADVVNQWCAVLDQKTRDTHRRLDGQIREVGDYFEINGKKAKYPGGFGNPAEDCNCRCVLLTRAVAALDEEELKTLQERAAFWRLDKSKDFEEFKQKYLNAADDLKSQVPITTKPLKKQEKSDTIKTVTIYKSVGASSRNYPVKLADSKQHTKLAVGQTITGTTFAGKGTNTELRDRFRLESDYHVPADEWEKVSGNGYIVLNGKNVKAELHWYEANGEIYEMKVKRYLDED